MWLDTLDQVRLGEVGLGWVGFCIGSSYYIRLG